MVSDSCFSFFKFSVGFGTTIGDLWDIYGLSVTVVLQIFLPLYIIFVLNLWRFGILCRRLEL